MKQLLIIVFSCLLASCAPRTTIMVIEALDGGFYHVVVMGSDQTDVVKLPDGTKEGDILKIKIKTNEIPH